MIEVDPQLRETTEIVERGHRLNQLMTHAGYLDLLQIYEDIADTYEARLINLPSGESDQLLRDLHIEAKVARAILQIVQNKVSRFVEMGRQSLEQTISRSNNDVSYSNL